jgi:hypothetical protein
MKPTRLLGDVGVDEVHEPFHLSRPLSDDQKVKMARHLDEVADLDSVHSHSAGDDPADDGVEFVGRAEEQAAVDRS